MQGEFIMRISLRMRMIMRMRMRIRMGLRMRMRMRMRMIMTVGMGMGMRMRMRMRVRMRIVIYGGIEGIENGEMQGEIEGGMFLGSSRWNVMEEYGVGLKGRVYEEGIWYY